MAKNTYDPSQVTVTIGGVTLTNWEKIEVERNEERWKLKAGSSGEVARAKNSNQIGKITITLDQTANKQGQLSAIFISDALISVAIADLSGASVHVMPEGVCQNVPKSEYAKNETSDRAWIFEGALTDHIVAGN